LINIRHLQDHQYLSSYNRFFSSLTWQTNIYNDCSPYICLASF